MRIRTNLQCSALYSHYIPCLLIIQFCLYVNFCRTVLCDISIPLSMAAYDYIHSVDNSGNCHSLWAVVVCQLETGEVELKTVSLNYAFY